MPIYEYHCEKCDRNFECLVFGQERPECPSCHSKSVNRLISACRFISKGGGGETVKTSASSCSGCNAASCAGCSR
ncbi:MAG TPA: zinc ribbon domain-containing protein [Desulfobacterales bacterium]|nr:zinc ribbon domain-containing protein [Desulfobacterales bacterium]